MAYNLLSEVDPTNKHCRVYARVARIWEYRGGIDRGDIQHLDLVLIDEQGTAMHAEIPAEHVDHKKNLLQEGHIYCLTRFLVCPARQKYRPVDNTYRIELTYYTEIDEVHQIPDSFPTYAYSLVAFADLPNYVGETRSFLDVLGVIISVSNAATIQSANQNVPSVKRIIILKDASNYEIKLTLWGQRATEFEGDNVYEAGQLKPITALFVGVLMKRYGHEEGLTGNAACRWYICPNIPEASVLASSMQHRFQSVSRITLRDQMPRGISALDPIEEKTLAQIVAINPFDFPSAGLRCTITIARLSPGQTWWFFSCNKCSRRSMPDNTSYKCSACPCRGAKPRYKLCVIGTDGTAESEFILFGDVGQQVVGKQVGAILRSNHGGDETPVDIARVVCTKYTWHVTISEKSFHGPKKSYQVNRIITAFGKQPTLPRNLSDHPTSSSSKLLCLPEETKQLSDKSLEQETSTALHTPDTIFSSRALHISSTTKPLDETNVFSDPTSKSHIQIQESHTVVPSARKRLFQTIQLGSPPDETVSLTSGLKLIEDPQKGKQIMKDKTSSDNNPASELAKKRKEDTTISG